jgi:hypothetical protein
MGFKIVVRRQMQINDPETLAELHHCHDVYEKALIDNDAQKLGELFWDSPHALRFGATENLHGADEIRAFRQARPKFNLDREIRRLDIMAFGDTVGVVNLEFVRAMDGVERHGRQSQFWLRFPDGWKIVSAHVSLLSAPPSYFEAASAQLGIPIDGQDRAAVNEDLSRIAAIAGFLMQFPLSQNIEPALVFHP